MRIQKLMVTGAAVAALAIAGCSSGPPIHSTVGKGTTFCNDMGTFSNEAAALDSAASDSLAQLQQQVPPVAGSLQRLQAEAPAADTVGGHAVKTDLATVVSVYNDLEQALRNASASSSSAVTDALSSVQAKDGDALTTAVGRLDSYAKTVCGLTGAPVTTTTSGTGPTVTAGTSGTSGVLGPSAATTSTSG